MASNFFRRPQRLCIHIALCFGLLTADGCSRHATSPPLPQPPLDTILATVDDENITAGQFSTEMINRRVADEPKARKALLDEMIRTSILAQEARQHGYERDPQVITAYDDLLAKRMLEEFHPQAKTSAQEIETYYKAHSAEFMNPAAIRAAVIFVATPAQMPPEARAERRSAIDKAREKALALPVGTVGFGALAAQYSDDQETKLRGGDMGFFVAGYAPQRWEKPVIDSVLVLTSAKPLSEVITTDRGYYFVKLTAKHEASLRPLNSVRSQIEKHLTDDKESQLVTTLVKKASDRQTIKIYDDRLAALSGPKPVNGQSAGTSTSPPRKQAGDL